MKCSTTILLIILSGFIFSCKGNYRFHTYTFYNGLEFKKPSGVERLHPRIITKRSIVIASDSTLNYTVMIHDYGASTTIKYIIENDIMKIDTVDIYKRNSFQNYAEEIFGLNFHYSKDSLTDIRNGEKYYSTKIK